MKNHLNCSKWLEVQNYNFRKIARIYSTYSPPSNRPGWRFFTSPRTPKIRGSDASTWQPATSYIFYHIFEFIQNKKFPEKKKFPFFPRKTGASAPATYTIRLHQARAKPWRSLGAVSAPLRGDGRRRITLSHEALAKWEHLHLSHTHWHKDEQRVRVFIRGLDNCRRKWVLHFHLEFFTFDLARNIHKEFHIKRHRERCVAIIFNI